MKRLATPANELVRGETYFLGCNSEVKGVFSETSFDEGTQRDIVKFLPEGETGGYQLKDGTLDFGVKNYFSGKFNIFYKEVKE